MHGSGDLTVRGLQAQNVHLSMRGPGDAHLEGSAATLNVELSGSGDLHAHGLTSTNATTRSRASGSTSTVR